MSTLQPGKSKASKDNSKHPINSGKQPSPEVSNKKSYEKTCQQLNQLSGMARFSKR